VNSMARVNVVCAHNVMKVENIDSAKLR